MTKKVYKHSRFYNKEELRQFIRTSQMNTRMGVETLPASHSCIRCLNWNGMKASPVCNAGAVSALRRAAINKPNICLLWKERRKNEDGS